MALTLAEAAKLSNDILLQGVIETIIKDSPILQRMPFIEMTEHQVPQRYAAPVSRQAVPLFRR